MKKLIIIPLSLMGILLTSFSSGSNEAAKIADYENNVVIKNNYRVWVKKYAPDPATGDLVQVLVDKTVCATATDFSYYLNMLHEMLTSTGFKPVTF